MSRPFPEEFRTRRLRLRRPRQEDAPAIWGRYAGDAEVTRYLSWPTHRSLKETQTFLQFAEEGWESGRSLTYLIEASGGLLLGSTGLDGETHYRYSTGYVLARDAWGRGFATEALIAILDLAFSRPEVRRVYALCDVSHVASARVMEKSGMEREAILRRHTLLPNLSAEPRDMLCYAMAR